TTKTPARRATKSTAGGLATPPTWIRSTRSIPARGTSIVRAANAAVGRWSLCGGPSSRGMGATKDDQTCDRGRRHPGASHRHGGPAVGWAGGGGGDAEHRTGADLLPRL